MYVINNVHVSLQSWVDKNKKEKRYFEANPLTSALGLVVDEVSGIVRSNGWDMPDVMAISTRAQLNP